MDSRKDGSFTYRHTEDDEKFNKREALLASIAELPGTVAVRAVFKEGLVEQAHTDTPTTEVEDQAELNKQLSNAS